MLAYNLLSIIVCGEVTVHTLYLGVLARSRSKRAADERLLNGLLELCDRKLIMWKYHPAYGDELAISKTQDSVITLLESWCDVFGYLGPRTQDPNPSTISVETSNNAYNELEREVYQPYEEFMDKWYG